MTRTIPPISPGRPETLTKEEDEKLKEFWKLTLKVFGVTASSDATPIESKAKEENAVEQITDDLAAAGIGADGADAKKKRSKMSMFKKKEQPPAPAPATASGQISNQALATVKVDDKDDKHGLAKEFNAALSSQTPEELREAFWEMVKCDNPDALLLRFLRARKWNVENALVMMVSTMQWRAAEMKVHEVIGRGENGAVAAADNDFMHQLRIGKSFLHGWDKQGRPICYVRVRLHKAGEDSEDSLERYTVYIMETARLMLNNHVDTAAVVFDMSGFSLANMDYAPVKFMIKCFEAHYPESLGVCLVHKAPWIFQGIWSIIKGWLDPVVASKIHFTKTQDDLEQFIPKEHIIKELGGAEDWEYKYTEPSPEEDVSVGDKGAIAKLVAERNEVVKKYEALTRSWILEEPAGVATDKSIPLDGSSALKLKEERFKLASQLKDGYWQLDKYIRGRTYYDRTGVIRPGGVITFYPQTDSATVEAA
ncbi:CRAL-TRIO domain-containing protein [Peziza echinospora]|nr:CRAL-TRIO domain-containing protein [Peziza echinospora]